MLNYVTQLHFPVKANCTHSIVENYHVWGIISGNKITNQNILKTVLQFVTKDQGIS